ncbi:MAG: glycosyltransferase family 39 protein [Chloroflexota bacterium]
MRTPILLFGAALAVRLVLIAAFPDPAYPDSFYYVNVARALAAGDGLRVDFIWIFADVGGTIPTNPILPIPSNAHWMPLASLVQVPFIWMLGPTAWASALPFAIIGAVAAPLTWAVARDAGARPLVSVSAGLLVATPVLSTPFMVQPDNFSLFQPLVLGALWLGARGLRGSGRAIVAAGALAGLATLSRNDGLLVMVALALAFAWGRVRAGRVRVGPVGDRPRIDARAALGAVGAFGLVMIPWWVRQLATFGSLSPSTASGKVLFIRSIEEWNSIATPATLGRLLAMGAGPLLATRIAGLTAAIGIFAQVIAGLILVPFLLVGGWARRRSSDFGLFFLYAALLFAFSALISAVHVPGGTFLHSAVALAPHSFILVVEGIVLLVDRVAARRPAWRPEPMHRLFVGAAIAFAGIMAVAGSVVVHSGWSAQRDDRQAVAAALDGAGVPMTDRIMSIDAAGYRYWTGRGGVVLVNDPIDTIRRVAAAYDIRWLVLNRADAVAAVESILDARARPDWVGAPLFTIPETGSLADRIGVYPVCLTPDDARCAG